MDNSKVRNLEVIVLVTCEVIQICRNNTVKKSNSNKWKWSNKTKCKPNSKKKKLRPCQFNKKKHLLMNLRNNRKYQLKNHLLVMMHQLKAMLMPLKRKKMQMASEMNFQSCQKYKLNSNIFWSEDIY